MIIRKHSDIRCAFSGLLLLLLFLLASSADAFAQPPGIDPSYKDRLLENLRSSNDFQVLCSLCSYCASSGEYDEAVGYADLLLEHPEAQNDGPDRLAALSYAAQAFLAGDRYERAWELLDEGLGIWEKARSDSSAFAGVGLRSVSVLYNGLGVYYINYVLDYEKATEYFTEGLEFAIEHNLNPDYSLLSFNLIMTYFIRESPDGLRYAEDIYRRGISEGDLRLTYIGAYESAMMCYLAGDFARAESYVMKALECQPEGGDAWVSCVYANILGATGRQGEARKYYAQALSGVESLSALTATYICLSYGDFLLSQEDWRGAAGILQQGTEIASRANSKVFMYQLYRSLSEAYSGMSHYKDALDSYKSYHQISDSIFNIRKERVVNELTMKYRTAAHEAEMKQKNLELMEKNYALVMMSVLVVIIAGVLVIVFMMYRHKDKMYTAIVLQYQDAIRKERLQDDRQVQKNIDQDKSVEIVNALEALMREKEIYRDNTLSRDRLAEIVGTNRTYLSKVVNDTFGKSVNQYINSYRVQRAVEMLSNTEQNLPMKAVEADSGFSSSSNFFKLFKEQVGMSPAKFREKVLELSRQKS